MPGLFYQPISRKQFLSSLAAGVVSARWAAAAPGGVDEVRLGILSDTHIPADEANEYRGFRPVANLEMVLPQVRKAKLDTVVINGDAARLVGTKDDYARLRQMLAPVAAEIPVYIGLGNHDDRGNFFDVFAEGSSDSTEVAGKHVAVIERPTVRVLVLDSLLYVNKVAGLLGQQQRQWLSRYLAESDDRPHVLFVHHTLGDGDGDLLDADRLFAVVEPHRKVKAIFYGHSHRYSFEKRGHLHLINVPAVGYNFADDQPVGWLESTFTRDGVTLTLHAVGGRRDEDGVTTFVHW